MGSASDNAEANVRKFGAEPLSTDYVAAKDEGRILWHRASDDSYGTHVFNSSGDLFSGHYDLSEDDAYADYRKRKPDRSFMAEGGLVEGNNQWVTSSWYKDKDEAEEAAKRIHDTTGCDVRIGSKAEGLDAYPVEYWTGPPTYMEDGGYIAVEEMDVTLPDGEPAIIGEAGPEAVIPLDNPAATEAIAEALATEAQPNGGAEEVAEAAEAVAEAAEEVAEAAVEIVEVAGEIAEEAIEAEEEVTEVAIEEATKVAEESAEESADVAEEVTEDATDAIEEVVEDTAPGQSHWLYRKVGAGRR